MENGLKELQQRLVEMLSSFQKFTQQNGMIFFLVGGSALGAVRHQGFIPWDDDVDIAMMREDFEKMEYLMSLQHDRLGEFIYSPVEKHMIPDAPIGYLYDTLHADAGYENTAKIDIHPIDGVPKSGVLKKVQKWTSLIYYLSEYRLPVKNKGKAIRNISKVILKITPGFMFRFYMRVCKKIMTSWRTSDSEYICSLFGVAGYEREVMPKSYLLPLKEADFENKVFMIPGNYDPYLKRLYGDYKKMPPEMEQHPRHKIHELYKK
jgi:lipopolysaccharide cholinephosphotransferase